MKTLNSKYVTLENNLGLKVVFSTLGAGVKSLSLNGHPLILELKDADEYLCSKQLFGKTVARFIGRLPSTINISDKEYHLEETSPGLTLHGGYLNGLTFREYEYEIDKDSESSSVIFSIFSKDGDCGFPGNLYIKVIYTLLNNKNKIIISYEAISDKDTILSLSNHMYWNLNCGSIDDYYLYINSNKYGVFKDESQLIIDSSSTPDFLSFDREKKLKNQLDLIEKEIPKIGTLDHTYVFKKVTSEESQVYFYDKNYRIDCKTDFDACNVYVDSTMNEVEFTNSKSLTTAKRRGIAIEPQQFVLDKFVLKKEMKWSHFISYEISKEK